MRGEYKEYTHDMKTPLGSPPLARGVHGIQNSRNLFIRITPACAGSTDPLQFPVANQGDHPRLRGEYPDSIAEIPPKIGSPPLARGVPLNRFQCCLNNRITPACAGSTIVKFGQIPDAQDHPRLRGEYVVTITTNQAVVGSPPLARGVRYNARQASDSARITPACAGSTLSDIIDTWLTEDHPRLRGEY